MSSDPVLPNVFTRSSATAHGLHRNQVTRRLSDGRFRRLTRGAFCLTSTWEAASPEQRHLLLARALTREESAVPVFSHVTAGVVHHLPASASALSTVWMTAPAGFARSTRYTDLLRREVATLDPREVTQIGDLSVTKLARTACGALCCLAQPLLTLRGSNRAQGEQCSTG